MRKGNIFLAAPNRSREEFFEPLIASGKVRIERIISHSNSSPEGFWYDQEESEWVMVVSGSAAIRIEGEEQILILRAGDWIDIPPRLRHRVEWTDPVQKTVWLAVFYDRK